MYFGSGTELASNKDGSIRSSGILLEKSFSLTGNGSYREASPA